MSDSNPARERFAVRIEPLELDVDVGIPGRRITIETLCAAAEARSRPCAYCRRPIEDPKRRVPRDLARCIVIAVDTQQQFCSSACHGQNTKAARARADF